MGLFTKKDKIYPLEEVMKKLQTPKYENHTTIPVEGGFLLVKKEKAVEEIEKIKMSNISNRQKNQIISNMEESSFKTQREEFMKRYEGYKTNEVPRNYNNYNGNNVQQRRYGDYYKNVQKHQDNER